MKKDLTVYDIIALIIAAASGSGKGTLAKLLFRIIPDRFGFSVSLTTRAPRVGEVNGKHYTFVDHKTFEEKINQKEPFFFEYKTVFPKQEEAGKKPDWYGTPLSEINRILEMKRIPLLDIDIKGGEEVMNTYPNACGVFVRVHEDPQTALEIVKKRLAKDDNRNDIKARLDEAVWEVTRGGNFHHAIVNEEGKLLEAVNQLLAFLNWRVFKKQISPVGGAASHAEKIKAGTKMAQAIGATLIDENALYGYLARNVIRTTIDLKDEKAMETWLTHFLFDMQLEFQFVPTEDAAKPKDRFELFFQGASVHNDIKYSVSQKMIPTLKNHPIVRDMVRQKIWNMTYGGKEEKYLVVGESAVESFPGFDPNKAQNAKRGEVTADA